MEELCREGESSLLASVLDLERRSAPVRAAAVGERLRARLEATPARPLSPWVYLPYYRIGQCVLSGRQPTAGLGRLLAWLETELASTPCPDAVVGFADRSRPEWQWRELLELFQEGGDFVDDLATPGPDRIQQWRHQIQSIRALLADVDPSLHQLMQQLQNLIVLVLPGPRARERGKSFGGATTFFFRGGTLINCAASLDAAELLERLVHEYAHAELFVLGQDQRLCRNDDRERHAVLIRPDPRPMHGIIHSLYVTARCADLIRRLRADCTSQVNWPPGLAAALEPLQERLSALGRSSLEAVDRHGLLTPRGDEVVALSRARLGLSGADGL